MFGDLMGNMEEKQKALQARLAQITVEAEAGEGIVKVQASGTKEILNISIDKSRVDDLEQVEDLMVVAVNRAIAKAAALEAQETQSMLSDILPPGMGDLGNLFG